MSTAGLLDDALRLQQAGRMPEAARAYAQVLRIEPANVHALQQLGLILLQNGQPGDAERLLGEALRIKPGSPELCYSRGCALQQLGRGQEALTAFEQALALVPDFVPAQNNRGVTYLNLGRPLEALECFDRILAHQTDIAMVHNNRATALLALARPSDALAAANAGLALDPRYADALFSRGSALAALDRRDGALAAFESAIAINPRHVDSLIYRGIILELLDRPSDALASYDTALAARPGDTRVLFNRTSALIALGRFEDAIADFDALLAADPHFKYAEGSRLFAKLQCCDWCDLAREQAVAISHQRAGFPVFQPLHATSMLTDGEELRTASRLWVEREFPPSPAPLWNGKAFHHDRIRIAYVSGDYGYHPVMVLMAGIFEQHDRARFELTAISTGRDDGSDLGVRLRSSFERFVEMHEHSTTEIAEMIGSLEIDIAVDLTGFTKAARTAAFAHRPCGIQVNFLGFPGTTAAPYFDYIIADPIIIGDDHEQGISEKIARLPHCCLPTDNRREIGKPVTRSEAGLPDRGFVFCNFGKPHKITPELFEIWMRLLVATPESVLWLAATNPYAQRNLRLEAECNGVSADRLIFANFVQSPERHLARISHADLFLDTFPYNAHATACDFLWAGVPVITLAGGGFAGRVGASILAAAGLDRLITTSTADYEKLASHLARNPPDLNSLREKLARDRSTCTLFDTAQFTRDLEQAYAEMWQRLARGEPPANITVAGGPTVA